MTDEGENNTDRGLPEGSDWNTVGEEDKRGDTKEDLKGIGRQQWEQLASDPKLDEDLGYAFCEWDEFETLDGSGTVMFLPNDEEVLKKDAFVVVAEDSIVDLGKQY